MTVILRGEVVPGDLVVIRYESSRGDPPMEEMFYPTCYLRSKGLSNTCTIITDGCFSGSPSFCEGERFLRHCAASLA